MSVLRRTKRSKAWLWGGGSRLPWALRQQLRWVAGMWYEPASAELAPGTVGTPARGTPLHQECQLSCFRFNLRRVPEALIPPAGARVMSMQDGTSKMSKSAESDLSRINLLDSPDLIVQKVKVGGGWS